MKQEEFNAILPVISADIVKMIAERCSVSEKEAIKRFYLSKVYEALEKEETKVWRYSTPMLYSLLEQEWNSGVICYPDV